MTDGYPLIPSMEKQVLFRRLCKRNAIRKQIGIRPMDVSAVFKRHIKFMTEQRYTALLEPYLATAFRSVEWPTGFTPRLLLAVKLHKQAVAQLQSDQGVVDPRTKKSNILAMIDKFVPSQSNITYIGNHTPD